MDNLKKVLLWGTFVYEKKDTEAEPNDKNLLN